MSTVTKLNYLDLVDGQFRETTAADLSALFDAVNSTSQKHILVHLHGGLVSRSAASGAADGLIKPYIDGGTYPVFFFWNSGALSVLANNLDEVAKEPVFWRLMRRLAQLLAGKLAEAKGTRGLTIKAEPMMEVPEDPQALKDWAAAREPPPETKTATPDLTRTQREQIERELQDDYVLKAESAAIAAGLREPQEIEQDLALRSRGGPPVRASRKTLMSPTVLKEIAAKTPEPGTRSITTLLAIAKYGVEIAAAVIKRYKDDRDHGLLITIAEEVARTLYADSIGSTIWTLMKNDTRDAFGQDPERFGGTAFVDHLVKWWQPGKRITLVGHSTGAIYIGYLLEQIDKKLPPEAKADVIFLAPACTFAFMSERLPLYERRVAGFRMFALHDALERGYWEVPVLYPASLLYMVSGLFEDPVVDMPILGMERYHSGKSPYVDPQISAVLKWIGSRIVWSEASGVLGGNTGAKKHGAFDDDTATLASLTYLLQNGF